MTWNPEDYAKHSAGQLVWATELMAILKLRGDEALLDVGCGDGKIAAQLAKFVPRGFVLGVDRSPEFISYAREHYPASAYPNLRFEQMDARGLRYDRQFDVLFSNAALHWVDDHPAILAGAARVLKTGGRLIVSCGGPGSGAEVAAVIDEVRERPRWAPYFAGFTFPWFFYTADHYKQWLPEAGFKSTRIAVVEKDMIHQGPEGLAGWLRTTHFPYTHCVPADQREAFLWECVEAYLARYPLDKAGQAHVMMVRLEIDAYKL